jgi:hypothetical protein
MRCFALVVVLSASLTHAHERPPPPAAAARIERELAAAFAPILAACRAGRRLEALERAAAFARDNAGRDTATANARASSPHRLLEGCLTGKMRRDRKVRAAWIELLLAEAAELERLGAEALAHEIYARALPDPRARAKLAAARRTLPFVAADARALEARIGDAVRRHDARGLADLTDPDRFEGPAPDSGRAFVRALVWPARGVLARKIGARLVVAGFGGRVRSFAVRLGPRAGGVSWQGWSPVPH